MPKESPQVSRRKTPDQHDHAPLSSAIGEFWSTNQVMARSGQTRDRLRELIDTHEVLHVTTADDQRLFPAFQFDGRAVRPQLVPLLRAMLPGQDGWSVTLQLMQPMTEFDGRTPLDVVEGGSDADRMKLLKILGA